MHYFAADNMVMAGEPYPGNTAMPARVRLANIASQLTPVSVNVLGMNDIQMPAFAAPIPSLVELGEPIGEWINGEWSVRLVPRVVDGNADLFAVCWEYRMPDAERVVRDVDNGTVVVPPGPPLEREQCSQHRRSDAVDVGATVEEAGVVYSGAWATSSLPAS